MGEKVQDPNRAAILPISEEVSRPLWSVMIPTYNCAQYLRETLASVLAQDPGSEVMQIEVIDDCSTKDDPEAIVEELGKGRVSFYRQPHNVGHIQNFNTCLQRSRGYLVHLLHGDDRVRDGFYKKMQELFEQNPEIGAGFCRHIGMSQEGHWEWFSNLEQSESGVIDGWLERISVFNRLQTPSMVVRRETYEKIGGFDRRSCYLDDWEMWVRIAAYYPVGFEVEPLAEYRGRAGSLTEISRSQSSQIQNIGEIISIIQSYLPSEIAKKLTRQARENWALFAVNDLALPMLKSGNFRAATTQIKEALGCSSSPKVIRAIVQVLSVSSAKLLVRKSRYWINLLRKPSQVLDLYIRPLILENEVQPIYGPQTIDYDIDELIVLCVVRNGELYIKSFIEHYQSLGVKHLVFLDNGSTDETVNIARQYENVTVLQTHCPYQKYETLFKQYLVNRFSKNRWNLFADIDELFDYPYSDVLSLKSLLTYLNQNAYTAVLVQMLDLFSEQPLAQVESYPDDNLKEKYRYYDIENLEKERYPSYYGVLSNSEIKWHWGGVRKTLFGTNNYLTKAALVFVDKNIKTFVNCHQVKNARIADFTCLFLHYPFVSSFYKKVAEAVKSNRYAVSASHEYQKYWERLEQDPNLNIKGETARYYQGCLNLITEDFLVVSPAYLHWVKTQSSTNSNYEMQKSC